MTNKLKRSASLIMAIMCFILSCGIVASAESEERVFARVMGLGIMEGYDNGDFGKEDMLTRAQMAMITARLLHVDNMSGTSVFTDVPNEHWANGVISILADMKVLNGKGDNRFLPDDNVKTTEAIKMMVHVLGYRNQAEAQGGYPYGYISVASSLGIVKHISISDNDITRRDVAYLVYDTLEAKPLEVTSGSKYEREDRTFYEIFSDNKDTVKIEGILQETERTSILSEKPTAKENKVIIGGAELECDSNLDGYIGMNVIAYVTDESNTGTYMVKTITPNAKNKIISANAKDVEWNGDTVEIKENGSAKKASFDSFITVYNGRKAELAENQTDIEYGEYKFIDNDGDGKNEIVIINEAQSFVISKAKTSESGTTVYFKNNDTFNGRNAVLFDFDDDDKCIELEGENGEEFFVDDIMPDMAITLFASKDENYIKAVFGKNTVDGKIDGIDEDYIYIDGEQYLLAKNPDGSTHFSPKLGDSTTFALDCYGSIVSYCEPIDDGYIYAYAIKADRKKTLKGNLQIKTVSGKTPEKSVKIKNGEEEITYSFQNDLIKIFEFEDKIKYNGNKINTSTIDLSDLNGAVIAYKLDDEGKIKEMRSDTVTFPGYDCTFNAKIMAFGGESAFRGYATDKSTVFVCVPETERNVEDDYYVQIKVKDDSVTNKVYGTVFVPDTDYEDPDSEPVDIVLIRSNMNSSEAPVISTDDDICIIGDIKAVMGTVYDDDGSFVYQLEMLNGNKKITEVTCSSGTSFDIASKLRKGDLIRFQKDGFGRIVNIKKLTSLQGLGNNFNSEIYIGAGSESATYGMAYHTVIESYDYYLNQMVDRITLCYDNDGTVLSTQYRLPYDDMPTIYKYDRSNGYVYAGSADDIKTYRQVGTSADNIFAIIEDNDIKALAIIVD